MSVIISLKLLKHNLSFLASLPRLTTIVVSLISWLVVDFVSLTRAGQGETEPLPATTEPTSGEDGLVPTKIPAGTFEGSTWIPPEGFAPAPLEDNPADNPLNVYYLDVGDGISVNVLRFPEFSFTGAIDEEGQVLVPLLGKISLVGLTLEEVEAKISDELGSRYLQENPEVVTVLVAPRPLQLTILGEVIRPGFYIFGSGTATNVLNNILVSTGGVTSRADLRSIIVRRSLKDGTLIEREVDLFTPLQTGREIPNVRLQGGDTIIISQLQVGDDKDYDRAFIARTTLSQAAIRVRIFREVGGSFGAITVPSGTTMIDVVGNLGDPQLVDIREIGLIRFDAETGGTVTQFIDGKMLMKGDIAQNAVLLDEDVIVVGGTLLGKVTRALSNLTRPFQSVFSFLAFFNTLNNLFDDDD